MENDTSDKRKRTGASDDHPLENDPSVNATTKPSGHARLFEDVGTVDSPAGKKVDYSDESDLMRLCLVLKNEKEKLVSKSDAYERKCAELELKRVELESQRFGLESKCTNLELKCQALESKCEILQTKCDNYELNDKSFQSKCHDLSAKN